MQNRLTQVLNAGTETDLVYDAVDRVWQTVTGPQSNGTITRLLYDGDRLIEEWDANTGNILRRYVHGVGTDEPLVWYEGATASDATRRYLHADHQGSIIGWSDQASTTAYTYGPYGEPQTWAGSRFRYTGQMAFSDAQVYDYKARAYDPMMGRFLQTDPIGQQDDPNLYAYVKGDPVDRSDPTGMADDDNKQPKEAPVCTGSRVGCGSAGGVDGPSSGYAFVGGSGYSNQKPTNDLAEGRRRMAEERKENGPERDRIVGGALAIATAPLAVGEAAAGEAAYATGLTAHGAERIAGAAATRGGVLNEVGVRAVQVFGRTMTQADGATVKVMQVASERYSVVVASGGRVVTTFERISEKSLLRLAARYGWK